MAPLIYVLYVVSLQAPSTPVGRGFCRHPSSPGHDFRTPSHLTGSRRDPCTSQHMELKQNQCEIAGERPNLRVVDAAVVEDKAGASESHARLLGFELELHDVMVSCRRDIRINER